MIASPRTNDNDNNNETMRAIKDLNKISHISATSFGKRK